MITTKVKWKAIFVSLFFLCLYLFLLYIVIFIAVYITYTYTPDEDDADSQKELEEKGYTLPEYAFVVECGGATSGESGVLEVRDGKLHLCYESKFKELKHHNLVEMIKTNPPLANPFYIYKEFSENNPELLVQNKNIKY